MVDGRPEPPPPAAPRSRTAHVVRWLVIAVVLAAVVVLLFEVVFPWFEVNYYDPSIG